MASKKGPPDKNPLLNSPAKLKPPAPNPSGEVTRPGINNEVLAEIQRSNAHVRGVSQLEPGTEVRPEVGRTSSAPPPAKLSPEQQQQLRHTVAQNRNNPVRGMAQTPDGSSGRLSQPGPTPNPPSNDPSDNRANYRGMALGQSRGPTPGTTRSASTEQGRTVPMHYPSAWQEHKAADSIVSRDAQEKAGKNLEAALGHAAPGSSGNTIKDRTQQAAQQQQPSSTREATKEKGRGHERE